MKGPAMWIVEGPASSVFLFGETVGVRASDVWLTSPIRAALDDCRAFWCEVADPDEVASSPLLGKHGLAEEPLSQRLNTDELRCLHEVARAVGVDPSTLEPFRPWLAAQLLEIAHRSRSGAFESADVHTVLIGLAKQADTIIRTELPDAAATLSFFATLGDRTEVDYLLWTADRVAAGDAGFAAQVAAWMAGDSSVVEQQVADMREQYPVLYRSLLADRNAAWVPRIDAMLAQPGGAFVLVGDSHLAGEEGIPALLAHNGLRPQRVLTGT